MSGRIDQASGTVTVGYDRAVELVQEFLGDLGIVDISDPSHARTTDDLYIIRFKTAAEALEPNTVVVVDRASGDLHFVTVRPEDADPWPEAKVPVRD